MLIPLMARYFQKIIALKIPVGCHWEDVRHIPMNFGGALEYAFSQIQSANPDKLYHIFGDAQWSNKRRLSDALLKNLMEHFSQLRLSRSAVDPDVLGRAYEYLIKKFADLTNKKAGEFYTPRSIVALMIDILDPQEHETVYDPACGTGGMLLEAVHHVREAGGDVRLLFGRLYGQEKNLTTSSIARINLLLNEIDDFQIKRGDTLRQPAFYEGDQLAQFDCVIANPPFSLKNWGHKSWEADPYGRNFAGLPPGTNGDYAWIQHMIKSTASVKGRMAVVLPHGVLFRMGQEGKIRRNILEQDLLDAVIGLGPNLFYGTGLSACILIFRVRKHPERQEKIMFIDASELYRRGRNQNTLEPEHAHQILNWYHDHRDVEGKVRVASLSEIVENDWNLNIPLYVEPIIEEETISVDEALSNLRQSLDEAYAAEDKLKELLIRAGLM